MFLKGQAKVFKGRKQGKLYHELPAQGRTIPIKLVPYYAWGNRGEGEMTVWLPVSQ